jgi:carbonic anhydrase
LRNAGNIIFDPMSSMTRTLALACAVKGGREIAIIGHTDCRVRATSVNDLIERFRALGVDRFKLPDNLVEFFGLFASERQNVINAVTFVRQLAHWSPDPRAWFARGRSDRIDGCQRLSGS